jgi:hypothetical protein
VLRGLFFYLIKILLPFWGGRVGANIDYFKKTPRAKLYFAFYKKPYILKKPIITFAALLIIAIALGQGYSNAGVRLARLKSKEATKDNIFRHVKNDLEFIQPKANEIIADIGSYDGYYPAMYSIFSDSVTFYLNDIDKVGFESLDSLLFYCSKIRGHPITNTFNIVIGKDSITNLPTRFFDKVILRDALHHFQNREKMLANIAKIIDIHKTG